MINSDSRFNEYITYLESLKLEGMFRSIPQIEKQGKWIKEFNENEKYNNSSPLLLNLSSNDYLGIIERKDLLDEFIAKTINDKDIPNFSAASSRLLTGNSSEHNKLEKLLCDIFNKEAALIFNSGYHANIGILPALCQKDSLIIADKLVHASIIDGIKLSGCNFERYRHNDCEHLETIIKNKQNDYKNIFVVTESIFSMGGDHAPLKTLVELKKKYPQIILYVDEAHAFGVYGASGLGLSEKYDLINDIDILVATLGKAISSVGAFVVCSKIIKEYLVNKMRPFIFSTALPPINIAWSRFIIEKLPTFTVQRENLLNVSQHLKDGLGCLTSNSNIILCVTGNADSAVALSLKLKEHGFYALPIRPPTVPKGEAGIRFSLTASITHKEVEAVIETILTNY